AHRGGRGVWPAAQPGHPGGQPGLRLHPGRGQRDDRGVGAQPAGPVARPGHLRLDGALRAGGQRGRLVRAGRPADGHAAEDPRAVEVRVTEEIEVRVPRKVDAQVTDDIDAEVAADIEVEVEVQVAGPGLAATAR